MNLNSGNAMDRFLEGQPFNSDYFKSVQKVVKGPTYDVGDRVKLSEDLEVLLSYSDLPEKTAGSVVLVKTAEGKTSAINDKTFVLFDDNKMRLVYTAHLCKASSKVASANRMVLADWGSIDSFFSTSSRVAADELIHKSTQDLWALKKGPNGFVIDRLFNDNGTPLKV